MKIITGSAIALGLMFSLPWGVTPVFGGDKDSAGGVPQYNRKTEVDFTGTIVKVGEVPAGEAFVGIHLTIQTKGEAIEVFLGPADFIKLMAMPLRPGLKDVGIAG